MADKITIRWEVEDGYAGPSRPQSTTVNALAFEDEDDAAIEAALLELVEDDFRQKVTWRLSDGETLNAIKQIRAALAKAE